MLTESQILSFRTRRPKRIAFVYPPYGEIPVEPGLRVVKRNYGVFPSLSLLYVAGAAQGAGHEALFLDLNARPEPWDRVLDRLRRFDPHYLCFTVTTYQMANDLMWIRRFREAFPRPVLAGGVHMGIYPFETMGHGLVDVGFVGECEISLPEFLELDSPDPEALAGVPGILYRRGAEWALNPAAPQIENADNAHFPARNLVDNSLYYSFITKYRNFTPFVSSRGCPHACIFCEQGHRAYRGRSPENVLAEMRECHDQYGVREFDFFDANFTVDRARALEICRRITASGMKVHWAIRSRVDGVPDDLLDALAAAGCARIYYGIESGDEAVLKNLGKGISLPAARDAIVRTRRRGIDVFGYFLFGSPGETVETARRTIAFARSLPLDYAQFSRAVPLPGTAWYRQYEKEFGRDHWRDTIVHPEAVPPSICRPGCGLSDEQINALCREAYLGFYFRLSYALRALGKIRSWNELARYVRVAWMMKFGH